MNLGKQLHELQQIDLELDIKSKELVQLEDKLGNDAVLKEAQAELDKHKEHIADLEKKQKTAEQAVDDLQHKLGPLQEKLFAGSVTNPKELEGLKQQVDKLKTQVRSEEDVVLELMGQIETSQKQISSKTAKVEQAKAEWDTIYKELKAELDKVKAAISSAEQRKSELTTTIDSDHIALYEHLRTSKNNLAVAKIEQGLCQGCRINLPMSELQRARVGELVQCGNCTRILSIG